MVQEVANESGIFTQRAAHHHTTPQPVEDELEESETEGLIGTLEIIGPSLETFMQLPLPRASTTIPPPPVTISSPIVRIYSQVADLGSACKLAPQSPGLPQTERLSMRVLKSILKLREVSSLSVRTIYSFPKRSSDQTYENKHQQT